MLYINKIDQKIYLKVGQNFVRVNIVKNKKDYTINPTNNKIEVYGNESKFNAISLEDAYKSMNKNFEKSHDEERNENKFYSFKKTK